MYLAPTKRCSTLENGATLNNIQSSLGEAFLRRYPIQKEWTKTKEHLLKKKKAAVKKKNIFVIQFLVISSHIFWFLTEYRGALKSIYILDNHPSPKKY